VQHISTKENKTDSFPPLQRRIVLHLAQTSPKTINETAKEISKTKKGIPRNYKSSWSAFKALEEKGLIKDTTSKDYKNRKYPRSWLTDVGVLFAVHEGAEPQALLKRTREIYPEDKDLHFLIEAAPILGKHALDVLYLAVLNRGAINQTDLISIFAAQTIDKLTPNQIAQFVAVLKKYPERHQQIRKDLTELADLL
jgi:hypothetical protein